MKLVPRLSCQFPVFLPPKFKVPGCCRRGQTDFIVGTVEKVLNRDNRWIRIKNCPLHR